jgi:hypothetical protein
MATPLDVFKKWAALSAAERKEFNCLVTGFEFDVARDDSVAKAPVKRGRRPGSKNAPKVETAAE